MARAPGGEFHGQLTPPRRLFEFQFPLRVGRPQRYLTGCVAALCRTSWLFRRRTLMSGAGRWRRQVEGITDLPPGRAHATILLRFGGRRSVPVLPGLFIGGSAFPSNQHIDLLHSEIHNHVAARIG